MVRFRKVIFSPGKKSTIYFRVETACWCRRRQSTSDTVYINTSPSTCQSITHVQQPFNAHQSMKNPQKNWKQEGWGEGVESSIHLNHSRVLRAKLTRLPHLAKCLPSLKHSAYASIAACEGLGTSIYSPISFTVHFALFADYSQFSERAVSVTRARATDRPGKSNKIIIILLNRSHLT